jgi:hypothetical protein
MSPDDFLTKADSAAGADPASAMTTFWSRWLEQSARGTQAMLEVLQAAGDPQNLQRRWLDAISRSLDEFMRTPAFMEVLKNHLKALTDLKAFQDQVVQDTARQIGAPLAADITGLFERLHSTEQTILNRLQAIEDRLKASETKQ